MSDTLIRWPDVIVLVVAALGMLVLGPYFARRNKSSESFFLAGRRLPGWLIGFSLMATIISSMTFLATPGFTYKADWRYMPTHFTYLIAATLALYLFMPFFRRSLVSSAYEYLELRFGLWARVYAGTGFILFQTCKAAIVLYAVSLPFQAMTGLSTPWFILIIGLLVGAYTIVGGFEAVVWADFIQALIMFAGAAICLPIIIYNIPGGFSELLEVAKADGKMYMGSFSMSLTERTFWVMMLNHIFWYSHLMCSDQMAVQRYVAAGTDQQARRSIWFSAYTVIPVWVYFTFLGTALYVLYKVVPDSGVDGLVPEQILPYFILTSLPVGLSGLVFAGIAAAAMSTTSSIVNSSAQILTTDFYRRLLVKDRPERHYLAAGRWFSFLIVALSIIIALVIHFVRSSALVDIQQMFITVLSGGLLGLFMIGFLTKRVDSLSALVATVITVVSVCIWLFLKSATGSTMFPELAKLVPDEFLINVISNIFIFGFAYLFAIVFKRTSRKKLDGLTMWTTVVRKEDTDPPPPAEARP